MQSNLLSIPNSYANILKKSISCNLGSGMIAKVTSASVCLTRLFMRTVLPVPISPVRRRKPLLSMIIIQRPARMIRLRSCFFGDRNPLSVQLLRCDKLPDRCGSFDLVIRPRGSRREALDRCSHGQLDKSKNFSALEGLLRVKILKSGTIFSIYP